MTIRYAILAVLGLVLAFFNPLVEIAAGYNLEIAGGGAMIYGSLRGMMSVMSIVSDADVQGSIGIASVSTSPGQALAPVIDTIERFANLLFALVIASGVLGFTLPIVASIGGIVLAVGAGGKAVLFAIGRPVAGAGGRVLQPAISLGVLAAIYVPLAYAVAFVLGDHYTASAWDRAAVVFEEQAETLAAEDVAGPEIAAEIEEPIEPAPTESAVDEPVEEGGMLDWAKSTFDGAVDGSTEAVQGALSATTEFTSAVSDQVSAQTKVVTDGLEVAGDLFQASVDIGVAYLVKLIVLPLVILAGLIWLMRSFSRPSSEFLRIEDGNEGRT